MAATQWAQLMPFTVISGISFLLIGFGGAAPTATPIPYSGLF